MENNHKSTSTGSWLPDEEFSGGAMGVFPSSSSADIAEMLATMAELAAIVGNQYREKAFMKAAKIFRSPRVPAVVALGDVPGLDAIPGIGPGILARVDEFIRTGSVAEITTVKQSRRYKAFIELTSVMGVGAKTAAAWMDLGVYTLGDLRKAVGGRRIVLTKQQELGLRYVGDLRQRIPRASVESIAARIGSILVRAFGRTLTPDRVVVAGSYRRGASTSGDIDILVRGEYNMADFTKLVAAQPEFIDFTTSGNERTTFLWHEGTGATSTARQVDILLRPDSAWGAALAYFTGDAQFAQSMRAHAKRLGYRLNQNGLYKINTKKNTKTVGRQIPLSTEEELFRILGLVYLEPKDRVGQVRVK